jgi:glycosyltransferase involved in cell wall biosynthesis
MSKTIYVLHERSTKEHFIALETYAEQKDLIIKYREFLIARFFVKSLLRLDFSLFVQQLKNAFFFVSLLFTKEKNVVLGIAPLDGHLPMVKRFLKKHRIFYFTSWGDWSGDGFPKNTNTSSQQLRNSWKDFLEQDVTGIFCVTKSALESLQENYHIQAPTAVVGHAVDNTIELQKEWRQKKSKETIDLIYVGRLVDTKGIYELIELMKQLDSEKFTLKIVGDGALKKEVETAAEKYANIQYLGYVKNKKELFRLYSQSDVQLLFSKKSAINYWQELFGMVIIEAMYCGLVTIATNHVGPRSIIENGVNGFLVKEETMVDETLSILNRKAFQNETMNQHAKETAQQFYKKNLAKKWATIFDVHID